MPAVRDLVALTKPRVTALVVVTTAGGLWIDGAAPPAGLALATLGGTALAVGAAGVLNCWMERDLDGKMARTRDRPIPAGRVSPRAALVFGVVLGGLSLPVLWLSAGWLAALLAQAALLSYVLVYTPMKRHSPDALLVGAVPGAIPPLIGGAAATGEITAGAATLAAILFFWQVPHFLAIALARADEYRAAGLKVVPVVLGARAARRRALVHAVALLLASLAAAPLGVAGLGYLVVAAVSGGAFIAVAARRPERMFRASLVHLVVLTAALACG
jgi:protoheme IX farnesyltransferase